VSSGFIETLANLPADRGERKRVLTLMSQQPIAWAGWS